MRRAAHGLSGLQIYISDDPIVDARDIEAMTGRELGMWSDQGNRTSLVHVDYPLSTISSSWNLARR